MLQISVSPQNTARKKRNLIVFKSQHRSFDVVAVSQCKPVKRETGERRPLVPSSRPKKHASRNTAARFSIHLKFQTFFL